MARCPTSEGRLVAVHVAANEALNLQWSASRGLRRKARWTVRLITADGIHGHLPALSDRMFESYTEAIRAIKEFEDE